MIGEAQDKNWPLPKFYFIVDWGSNTNIPFQEVSELEIESEPMEYRHSNSSIFSQMTCQLLSNQLCFYLNQSI